MSCTDSEYAWVFDHPGRLRKFKWLFGVQVGWAIEICRNVFTTVQVSGLVADLTYYLWRYWRLEERQAWSGSILLMKGLATAFDGCRWLMYLSFADCLTVRHKKTLQRKRKWEEEKNWPLCKTLSASVLWTALLGPTLLTVIKHAWGIFNSSLSAYKDLKTRYGLRAADKSGKQVEILLRRNAFKCTFKRNCSNLNGYNII